MTHLDWKEAAEKYANSFEIHLTGEEKNLIAQDYLAGAEHACERLKQQAENREETNRQVSTALVHAYAEIEQLEQRLEDAENALRHYAGRTVSVKDGHIRLNYHGTEDGPGMCFFQGEEWLVGDSASAYFAKHAGGEK